MVVAIRESVDKHDAWFDDAVRPLLPPGTPEPIFVDLLASSTRYAGFALTAAWDLAG